MTKLNSPKWLSLGALAFLTAGIAQLALSSPLRIGGWTINGWLVYAVAAILFIAAFRQAGGARFALGQLNQPPRIAEQSALTRRQWLLMVDATVAMLCSALLFREPQTIGWAWTLHIVSVLFFVSAFISFGRIKRIAVPSLEQLTGQAIYALPLVAVLALAAFARLWQLGEFPFGDWTDEASNGLAAAQILQDASFRPVFIQDTLLPAHFNYLIAFSFSLLGANVVALRLVTAALGVAAVLFAYLLFRRWFGQGMGIVAACMLSVMRYHLTFSRFGMQGIATPAFELAGLYFLDRALAEKKVSDNAWLGLTLGFGLAFYFAFRLLPVVLLVFFLCLLIAALAKYGARETNRRYVKGMWQQWLITLLGLLIALTPVLEFAIRNQQEFTSRMSTTSIFQNREEPELAKAYRNNLARHLEMFNLRGDNNGRHNLPGAPMLDPVMGALFILGAAFALWRVRDPSNLLMLLLFIFMLHGGILSLDFEAPQSLRSIGVIPALVYFITLPLAVVGQTITQTLRDMTSSSFFPNSSWLGRNREIAAWGVVVLAVVALVSYLNLDMFFNKQKNDPSAWAQYSTPETIVANEMRQLAADNDFIVTALYSDSPTVRFLAGDITNRQSWTVTDRLPLVRDATRGVVIFLDEKLMSAYREALHVYPNAQFQQVHPPGGDGTVLWKVMLSPADLRAAQGVVAKYYKGAKAQGTPAKEEVISRVDLDWLHTQPLAESFTAELQSILFAQQYGVYLFQVRGDSFAKVWIDENLVGNAPITLARGAHALRLQVGGGVKKVDLWWQPPNSAHAEPVPAVHLFRPSVTNNGLLGAYYPSPEWSGPAAFTQIDPELNYYFHVIPLPRPYSVVWTGKLYAPVTGDYKFALMSIDGSRLELDQQLVVENPEGQTTTDAAINLSRGLHDIVVKFSDKTGATRIYLFWTLPGSQTQELVPTRYLLPPMGRYPNDLLNGAAEGNR